MLWPREGVPHAPVGRCSDSRQSEEDRAAQIVMEMENDVTLMEDNPLSEQLRM
jgi:hypothetical protein